MNLDLPIVRSLAFDSPNKLGNTGDSDLSKTENLSDTIDRKFLPAPPRSPRLLGGRSIARVDLSRKGIAVKKFLAPPPVKNPEDTLKVKNTIYTLHELIGSGGSSLVYKVTDSSRAQYALKQVKTANMEQNLIECFRSEIDLLKALYDNHRVVTLYNYEITASCITLVMERGDSDLSQIIRKKPLDNETIHFYTIEILECVASVHECNIVHSDLKPANIIAAKGAIKLIDFGIAAPIPDFTCNVHKSEQIGTVSYMAPEAFYEHTGALGFKVGKPSDLWSCGCMIYEMFYGKPPFHIYGRAQMQAIMHPNTVVGFPEKGVNGELVPRQMIELMKGLLTYDLKERFTCERALKHLKHDYVLINHEFALDLVNYLVNLVKVNKKSPSSKKLDILAESVFNQLHKLTVGK